VQRKALSTKKSTRSIETMETQWKLKGAGLQKRGIVGERFRRSIGGGRPRLQRLSWTEKGERENQKLRKKLSPPR